MADNRRRRIPYSGTAAGAAAVFVIACALLAALPDTSRAQIPFPTIASWVAWADGPTNASDVADVDLDGDLDLVCITGGRVLIYENIGGALTEGPPWSSDETNNPGAIALGDLNGDDFPDLVCGTSAYYNNNGTFPLSPDWRAAPEYSVSDVALGDVDQDGDLDLVCAASTGRNTIHLNVNGTLSPDTSWATDAGYGSQSVHLGDVTGDGMLDMIGDGTVFAGTGSAFSRVPTWESVAPAFVDNDIGDMDGDGQLDLVLVVDHGILIYVNTGTGFANTDTIRVYWEQSPLYGGPVLGDVDRDGDLDLAFGDHNFGDGDIVRVALNNLDTGSDVAVVWNRGFGEFGIRPNLFYLADISGDGALDLIFGEQDGDELFVNVTSGFSSPPVWVPPDTSWSGPAKVGLVDEDNFTDVVATRDTGEIGVFRNDQGTLAASPSMLIASPYGPPEAVVDIDGDGHADLVTTRWSLDTDDGGVGIYYGQPGLSFADTLGWQALSTYVTAVEPADVDRNGLLDLVCASGHPFWGGYGSSIFLNYGDSLSTARHPNSGGVCCATYGIDLGYINDDRRLDLVFATDESYVALPPNAFHLNTDSLFPGPATPFGPATASNTIELGDINGDGNVDVVAGGSGCLLNLGTGEGFSGTAIPFASGLSGACRLGDINGDGRLDALVSGNGTTLYLNDGGMFADDPAWSAPGIGVVEMVDFDRDGDLDLLASSGLHLGSANPPNKSPADAAAHAAANYPAHIRFLEVTREDANTLTMSFTAFDRESDDINVWVEYQFEGVVPWIPADVGGGVGRAGRFASSPTGVQSSFTVDLSRIDDRAAEVVFRLKAIENPQTVSRVRYIPSYLVNVGTVEPQRPRLQVSNLDVSFGSVTVGDTVSTVLTLTNVGNVALEVDSIALPNAEMGAEPVVVPPVAPGSSVDVSISFRPRQMYGASLGDVGIYSNDPIDPLAAVHATAQVRPLEFTTKLLAPSYPVPLGLPLTVEVTPYPEVHIEGGFLVFRRSDRTEFADSVALQPSVDEFFAVIPEYAVTEAGVDYFIRVENSGVYATYPPGAPAQFDVVDVAQPDQLTSVVVERLVAGNEAIVQVQLPDGADFLSGTLHYRRGGEAMYSSTALDPSDDLTTAAIPDTAVAERGIEYWVEVQTLTTTLTDPSVAPDESPRKLEVEVPRLAESAAHGGGMDARAYRMISIPLRFDELFEGTIEALLSDQPEFGSYDPTRWRCWAYEPGAGGYRELGNAAAADLFRPGPGRAWWLICKDDHRIDTAPITGFSVPTDAPSDIVLAPGSWNMVGTPYAFPVSWDSVLADTMSMAEATGVLVDPPWRWAGGGYRQDVTRLEPFAGYWVYNRAGHDVVLHVPPREAMNETGPATVTPRAPTDGWKLQVSVAANGLVDVENWAGMLSGAQDGPDRSDRIEPPPVPGDGLALYFVAEDERGRVNRYASDMRAPNDAAPDWGSVWAFDIAKQFARERGGDEVTIAVNGLEGLPHDARAELVDTRLDRRVPLDESQDYRVYLARRDYVGTEESARYRLVVGSAAYVEENASRLVALPAATALYPNYPNPFNPSTVIRYDVASAGRVTLRVYNVRGALVRVLADRHRDPGRYEVGWNGDNARGERVASGVYFYRLTAGGFSQTRKMVLLK